MHFEPLLEGVEIALSKKHRFTTDAVLLSRFASPKPGDAVCDLCCGAGAVPFLWFGKEESHPRFVVGVDIDEEAVALFGAAVEKNRLGARILAVQGDVRNLPRALLAKTFDVVTCNPPYHKQQPGGDPTRFETACGIGDVFGAAARLLRFMGRLCICHRPERLPELMAGMQSFRIEPKRMRLVAYKTGNKPRLVLLEGKLGAKPGLDVLPTLVLADVFGTMTPEVAEMYRRR